jgi:hypothetical protein
MHTCRLPLALLLGCVVQIACSSQSSPPQGPDSEATGGRSASGGRSGTGGSSSASGGSAAGSSGGDSGAGGGGGTSAGSGGAAGSGGSSASGGSGAGGAAGAVDASDGDAAVTPDAGSSAGTGGTPGSTGPLPMAVRKVVILHDATAGSSAGDPSRGSMMEILAGMKDSHGIVVEWMDSPTKAADLMDKALIIVGPNSSMFGANHPDPGLKTIPVPLMVSKDGNTTEIGLGAVKATDPPNDNKITMIKIDHPLAAGLPMGSLTVLTTPNAQRIITYGGVGPDAIKIATGPDSAATYAIIGYEKGGDMGGGVKAPARRVGFFWHRPAAATPEGKKLFAAAVDWLLR